MQRRWQGKMCRSFLSYLASSTTTRSAPCSLRSSRAAASPATPAPMSTTWTDAYMHWWVGDASPGATPRFFGEAALTWQHSSSCSGCCCCGGCSIWSGAGVYVCAAGVFLLMSPIVTDAFFFRCASSGCCDPLGRLSFIVVDREEAAGIWSMRMVFCVQGQDETRTGSADRAQARSGDDGPFQRRMSTSACMPPKTT